MPTSDSSGRQLSRRRALGLFGAAALGPALGSTLAACGGRSEPGEGSGAVTLATTIATQQDEPFLTEWLGRFTDETGIQVATRFYPDQQYADSIQLLFQGDDRPDVFRLVKAPAEMSAAFLKGWIQPLDDFQAITDVLERDYPPEALDEVQSGLHIDGKLYGTPSLVHRPWGATRPLLYNEDLMNQYGVAPPTTWGELREAAEKITRDSKGEVFGFGISGVAEPLSVPVFGLQNTAGPQMTDPTGTVINYQTGKPGASHPSFAGTIDLLRGLAEAEVLPRGWEALQPAQLWQQFASGRIAMAVIASWWSAEIRKINPDITVGYAPAPVPDSGRKGYGAVGGAKNPGIYQPYWGISKGSPNAQKAARVLAFLAELEPQLDYYRKSKLPTALADRYVDQLSADDQRLLELAEETERLAPNPMTRNADAIEVLAAIAQKGPKPTLQEIFFDAISGKTDYESAAATFDDELAQALDAEIKNAQERGSDIDESTFTFRDWDPLRDYTGT